MWRLTPRVGPLIVLFEPVRTVLLSGRCPAPRAWSRRGVHRGPPFFAAPAGSDEGSVDRCIPRRRDTRERFPMRQNSPRTPSQRLARAALAGATLLAII